MENNTINFFANSLGAVICALVAVFSITTSLLLLIVTDKILLLTLAMSVVYSIAFVHFDSKVHKIIDNAPDDEIHS